MNSRHIAPQTNVTLLTAVPLSNNVRSIRPADALHPSYQLVHTTQVDQLLRSERGELVPLPQS